jgi:hypothetical protein
VAVDELHREETELALDKELVQRNEILVRHVREAAELTLQPVDRSWFGAEECP